MTDLDLSVYQFFLFPCSQVCMISAGVIQGVLHIKARKAGNDDVFSLFHAETD